MATTPPIASGVSISTAGAGGGLLSGDMTGLGGLFAALVGDAAAPSAGGEITIPAPAPDAGAPVGMVSVLLGGAPVAGKNIAGGVALQPAGVLATHVAVSQDVQLGDAPVLSVTGDAEAVAAFVAQVQEVFKQITQDGKLSIGKLRDTQELAGALTEMGMAPEEALGVAERIQTMLRLLEQQQEIDDETAGSLVAMMLAVMGQGAPQQAEGGEVPPAFSLQIASVETEVTVRAVISPMHAWKVTGGDVTRDMLGLMAQGGDKAIEFGDGRKAEPVTMMQLEVTVSSSEDGVTRVGMMMPQVKPHEVAVTGQALLEEGVPSDAAQAAAAVTTTGAAAKVRADELLEAPKGQTYYKLQADKNGVETLEAVKPVSEAGQPGTAALQGPAQPAHVAAAAAANAAASEAAAFAEHAARIEQINEILDKAQVGRQVMVQMQPLLEQGGGMVRMNLHPHQLGQVTVELQVVDGKVQGSIAATEPAVVEQLARELHTLRHGLADAGLKLGDQGINLMLSQRDQQGGQQDHQGQGGNHRQAQGGTGGGEGETGLTANLAGWIAPDRVLDVNV